MVKGVRLVPDEVFLDIRGGYFIGVPLQACVGWGRSLFMGMLSLLGFWVLEI